ncbi:MAG TPA: PQQ-dependent dehydrogenase, methanol/ethanol family [Bryobacteraceae bacterium]|nr:PQQ-dependent dehydrogenase, methanol/ethanol family [Bryobacteraceae bacterium]
MKRLAWTGSLLLAGSLTAPVSFAQVSFDRILNANKEPQNWLTYSGNLSGQRYSELAQITPANVGNLEMNWAFQARSTEKFETTPLVVDGKMYITQAPNDVIALDAATGRTFWVFNYTPSTDARPCCGRVNRGVAVLGDTLFMATIDSHLIAIDATNGRPIWNVETGSAKAGYAMTHAPLVVKDKVIVGVAGGEYGIRGYIAAYDARTGKEAWRFYTIPGPGEPGHETWSGDSWMHGGASVWMTGSYDADANLTYWGVGNPGPDFHGNDRPGDNLYSDCVVALDADTGKLKWYFQFTPHDVYDYDSVQVPVLADMEWKGRNRKIMLWANRNGFYYALDRTTGEFLNGKPFSTVTWAKGLDERGRPMRIAANNPASNAQRIYPGPLGATNWYSPSYSPRTGLFYIPAWDNTHAEFQDAPADYKEGKNYTGGVLKNYGAGIRANQVLDRKEEDGYGVVRAIDAKTGERKWEFKMADLTMSGILTTASDLLFTGSREGYFSALDARDGRLLWKVSAGGDIAMGPMTYQVNGKQYVAFAAGSSLFAFALRP